MHVVIFNVMAIRLLVIVSAKTRKALVAQVSFNRVHASYQHIKAAIELLFV